MTKAELVAAVADRSGADQGTAERVIGALFDTMAAAMKGGDKVTWPGFGSFSASSRSARQGRNPSTGETINIPASTAAKFSAASALKTTLNG
jgi:DNA-binding protein HU-beta